VLQEDGYARIVGRMKDVIIRNGDKIFPSELEEFFMTHPDVMESQVQSSPEVFIDTLHPALFLGCFVSFSTDEGAPCC
jgi:acyl-CoA synthetase (AMP-forming)/AMP-acid ligase II